MASDTVVIKRQSGGGETAENSNRLDVDEHEMSRETLFLSFGNANTSGCLFFFFFHGPFSNQNISQPTRFQVESLENKRKKTVNQYRFSIFSNELNDRFVSKLKDSQKKNGVDFNLSIFIIPYRLLRGILSVMNDRIFSSKRRN